MKKHFNRLALIATVTMLAACAIPPASNHRDRATEEVSYQYTRLAPSAPPQIIFETKPIPTLPMKQIWRPGHWEYDGVKFNWTHGIYILRPDPTASWVRDRWERHTYGYAFIAGHWK